MPSKKYWLGDAGYSNSDTILVLYCSTRYHLKEYCQASKKPENSKELFNLRYSLLRNAIECIFGILKRKYQILCILSEYLIEIQAYIIIVCIILYN